MSVNKRKRKIVVGQRQIYRRVNEELSNILIKINENNESINILQHSEYNNLLQDPDNENNRQNFETFEVPSLNCNSPLDFHDIQANLFISSSISNEYPADLYKSDISDVRFDQESSKKNASNSDFSSDFMSWVGQWTTKYNVSKVAVTDMLHFFSKYFPDLPLDSRTILKTPKSAPVKVLGNGEFCYFGLKCALMVLLSKLNITVPNPLEISFNIDGIPLFHSSNLQFWPILGLVKNFYSRPFVIGIYCGQSKPCPLSQFLNQFVDELNTLVTDGFKFNEINYRIKIHSFICDAPARAFIKCTKSHTGYSSCDRCTAIGEYYSGRVIFDAKSSPLRTNTSFREQHDEDHHLGESPLLDIDLVNCFVIDYMHCICLGVVRKLLNTWISGPLKTRIGQRSVQAISSGLEKLKKFVPVEFTRKPRSLSELSRWKATELRTFLLYLAPTVLKDVLDIAIYENFLLLHCAVTILVSPKYSVPFLDIANELLKVFVEHCKTIYGLEFLVYNVHMLTHICDDVKKYGPLDQISAFPFENYLGQLKKLIKSPKNPLVQIFNRLSEINASSHPQKETDWEILVMLEHMSGPLLLNNTNNYKQYKKLLFKNTTFSVLTHSRADAYCIIDDVTIIQIENILTDIQGNQIFLLGKKMLLVSPFFCEPVDSTLLGIHVIQQPHNSALQIWNIDSKTSIAKSLVFPYLENYVSFPLIHSEK